MGLLLPSGRVCSYVKRAKRPLIFFNSEVLIESRASDSTSKAIFCTIIKKKKATKIYLGYAKTYRDKIYPKPPWLALLCSEQEISLLVPPQCMVYNHN